MSRIGFRTAVLGSTLFALVVMAPLAEARFGGFGGGRGGHFNVGGGFNAARFGGGFRAGGFAAGGFAAGGFRPAYHPAMGYHPALSPGHPYVGPRPGPRPPGPRPGPHPEPPPPGPGPHPVGPWPGPGPHPPGPGPHPVGPWPGPGPRPPGPPPPPPVYPGYYWGPGYYPGAAWAAGAAAATAVAIGTTIATLPPACAREIVDGLSYELCGETWYRPTYSGNQLVYVAVAPPR
jgi:hypothetical protein